MLLYRIARFIAFPIYTLLYRPKVIGKENLPENGNYIIISNHFGKVDVFALAKLNKKKTYFMAKKEWFDTKFKNKLFRWMGAIPVDREKADLTSIKNSLEIINRGDILVIFPEGTRNKVDTELQPIKGGASLIAYKAKTAIVPVAMNGKYKIFKKNYLYIGKPFDYSEYLGDRLNSELNAKLTEIMRDRLADCVLQVQKIEGKKN